MAEPRIPFEAAQEKPLQFFGETALSAESLGGDPLVSIGPVRMQGVVTFLDPEYLLDADISFSGELAFEINVEWGYARSIWERLWILGRSYDLTAYGTETMHVLRAEKGYIIVGQDTDGTQTPHDLNMSWVVSKKKEFIGKRSFQLPYLKATGRQQLVGLLPENGDEVTSHREL